MSFRISPEETDREAARREVRRFLDWAFDGINATKRDLLYVEAGQYDDDEITTLIAASESQQNFYDALVKRVVDYTRTGLALPGPLAEFTIEALNGERGRPKQKGRPGDTNFARDVTIAQAIEKALAVDGSLHPYRNDASAPDSACDMVREVLAERGLHLSYDAVRHIWRRQQWPVRPRRAGCFLDIGEAIRSGGINFGKSLVSSASISLFLKEVESFNAANRETLAAIEAAYRRGVHPRD